VFDDCWVLLLQMVMMFIEVWGGGLCMLMRELCWFISAYTTIYLFLCVFLFIF